MSMSSTGRRRVRAAALSATAVLGAGALGAAIAPAASAAAGPSECRTADLSVQLKPGSPGAGQRYATVVLTNTSGHTCTVTGYGGLALLGTGITTRKKKLYGFLLGCMLFSGLIFMSACGGSSSGGGGGGHPGTPAGTYTITITGTAASGSPAHPATVTLTVQ